MPKITKRLVDAAEARTAEYFVWDSEIPGFGLRVLPSGRKGDVVQYRAGRRSRRISLGPTTVLSGHHEAIKSSETEAQVTLGKRDTHHS